MEYSDYIKYRGKCKEFSENYIKEHPTNTKLVRGYYHCPIWGKQQHWWVEELINGSWCIVDLTKEQFPSKGLGTYEEFDGNCECENCGKSFKEVEGFPIGKYLCCSQYCCAKLVGL